MLLANKTIRCDDEANVINPFFPTVNEESSLEFSVCVHVGMITHFSFDEDD